SNTAKGSQPEQLTEVRCNNTSPRKYREDGYRSEDCAAASIPVAHITEEQSAEKNTDQARAEHRPQGRAIRDTPIPDQRRASKCDIVDVKPIGEHHERRDREQPQEERIEASLVEDRIQVNRSRLRQ